MSSIKYWLLFMTTVALKQLCSVSFDWEVAVLILLHHYISLIWNLADAEGTEQVSYRSKVPDVKNISCLWRRQYMQPHGFHAVKVNIRGLKFISLRFNVINDKLINLVMEKFLTCHFERSTRRKMWLEHNSFAVSQLSEQQNNLFQLSCKFSILSILNLAISVGWHTGT